jgi:hypothetical protein
MSCKNFEFLQGCFRGALSCSGPFEHFEQHEGKRLEGGGEGETSKNTVKKHLSLVDKMKKVFFLKKKNKKEKIARKIEEDRSRERGGTLLSLYLVREFLATGVQVAHQSEVTTKVLWKAANTLQKILQICSQLIRCHD